ncbi:phosphotransferase enzyme family-domain-containing protein [Hysterangium stoloniferum]|nr:phosphotransferase enzyme family-domain-containing protein [Hysterangium stoloniferum]
MTARNEVTLHEDEKDHDIDDSRSESSSCRISQTSTELFETFSHQAHDLLGFLFPNDLPIEVKHMAGGASNRVVRGTLRSDSMDSQKNIVLRIPRVQFNSPTNEVAVLSFLAEKTSIPVPRVLHFDASSSNIISNPFVILEYLPGSCLEEVYQSMPIATKRAVISSMVHLLKDLSQVSFGSIGRLIPGSPDDSTLKIGHVVDRRALSHLTPPALAATADSIRSYLEERWAFFEREEQRCNPGDTFDVRYNRAFRAAAAKLPIPDAETPARIVLYHPDLAPRNIFVDPETGKITGVLDWDRAESAPVEAAWQMPAWLWGWDLAGSDQLQWVDPDDIPTDPEAVEIKEIFVKEVNEVLPGFVDTVTSNKLVFELLTFARIGLYSQETIFMADDFFDEWTSRSPKNNRGKGMSDAGSLCVLVVLGMSGSPILPACASPIVHNPAY